MTEAMTRQLYGGAGGGGGVVPAVGRPLSRGLAPPPPRRPRPDERHGAARMPRRPFRVRIYCNGDRFFKVLRGTARDDFSSSPLVARWLGGRVVSVLDSGAEGPGLKSQSRRCPVTVLGKLFTPVVPLLTKQRYWQQFSSGLRG